jgi:hypothetical protein
MHRATPLAQVESTAARSTPQGTRPTLVVIRGGAAARPVRTPVRSAGPRSDAFRRFAAAAERRHSSMRRLSVVALRMAGQAEHMARTLRSLEFAGSIA